MLLFKVTSFLKTQRHDGADVLGFCDDLGLDERFFHRLQDCRIRQVIGCINNHPSSFSGSSEVRHVWNCRDHLLVKFTRQSLLNDFKVEHAQESAPEAKAQCGGCLRFKNQRGIVELKFFKTIPQVLIILILNRVYPGENHWLDIFKTVDWLITWVFN